MNKKLWLILVLAAFLRLWRLEEIPFRVDGDASRFALDGIRAWQEKWPLFETNWYGQHANLLFYSYGLFLKIFGENPFGNRLFSAIGGILGVLATYLFAQRLFGKKVALYSAFFLSVSFFHLIFSRLGLEVSWMSFFAPIVLYFFLKKGFWANFFAGVFLGASQYVYHGSRLIYLLVFFLGFLLLFFRKRTFSQLLHTFIFLSFGFLLVYLPMISYYLSHPENYLPILKIAGIIQSGWLEKQLETRTLREVLFEQIKNSYFPFWNSLQKPLHFWVVKTPFLEKVAIVFFSLGILRLLRRVLKTYKSLLLLFYFFGGIFLAGVLTVDSPRPNRYVILFPAVAIFVGLGMERFFALFKRERLKKVVIFFSMAILFFESLFSYWQHETIEVFKYDINTQIATYAGRYLAEKEGDYKIYFLGNDYMHYNGVPTLPFLTKREGIDIKGPLIKTKSLLKEKDVVIILPSREMEIEFLQEWYPQGRVLEFRNPQRELLFFLFEI